MLEKTFRRLFLSGSHLWVKMTMLLNDFLWIEYDSFKQTHKPRRCDSITPEFMKLSMQWPTDRGIKQLRDAIASKKLKKRPCGIVWESECVQPLQSKESHLKDVVSSYGEGRVEDRCLKHSFKNEERGSCKAFQHIRYVPSTSDPGVNFYLEGDSTGNIHLNTHCAIWICANSVQTDLVLFCPNRLFFFLSGLYQY